VAGGGTAAWGRGAGAVVDVAARRRGAGGARAAGAGRCWGGADVAANHPGATYAGAGTRKRAGAPIPACRVGSRSDLAVGRRASRGSAARELRLRLGSRLAGARREWAGRRAGGADRTAQACANPRGGARAAARHRPLAARCPRHAAQGAAPCALARAGSCGGRRGRRTGPCGPRAAALPAAAAAAGPRRPRARSGGLCVVRGAATGRGAAAGRAVRPRPPGPPRGRAPTRRVRPARGDGAWGGPGSAAPAPGGVRVGIARRVPDGPAGRGARVAALSLAGRLTARERCWRARRCRRRARGGHPAGAARPAPGPSVSIGPA
jgi:hypothetical protein